jgi:prepilin-type N-terminal cleavage/methylation domain-containing protein
MRKGHSGWSLLEMVIALTIFGIVMAAIFGVLIPTLRAFAKNQIRHELYMQTEQALNGLNQKVSDSFGWLEGDSARMLLVSRNGDTISIYRDVKDSVLYVNRRPALPAGYKTAEFGISYKPMCDSAMSLSSGQWFIIADSDQDGLIKGEEITKVVSLELKMTVSKARENYTGSTFPRIPPAIMDIEIGE